MSAAIVSIILIDATSVTARLVLATAETLHGQCTVSPLSARQSCGSCSGCVGSPARSRSYPHAWETCGPQALPRAPTEEANSSGPGP